MLNDRQPKACAAPLFGVALVHTVEPLEYPLLMLLRDSDPGVGDTDLRTAQCTADPYGDTAVVIVILDRIFADIVYHLIQDLADALLTISLVRS